MTSKVNISTTSGASVQTVSEAVATRLREYRKQQRLTLDALSRRSGVSKGMLVEIENCAANPSIAILCKIAAALGVSVADIVNVTSSPAVHLIQKQDIPTLWTGGKGGSARLLAGTSGPTMVELWRWEMQPGETFESTGHPDGTSELLHVEQGQLKIVVNETEFLIAAGCSAVAKTDTAHQYSNVGKSKLIFTMTVSEPH